MVVRKACDMLNVLFTRDLGLACFRETMTCVLLVRAESHSCLLPWHGR